MNKDDKMCPVMSARLLVEPAIDLTPGKLELGPVILPCAKEKCAWWNNAVGCCCIMIISASLMSIDGTLESMRAQKF